MCGVLRTSTLSASVDEGDAHMIRAVILFEGEPEAARYEQHLEDFARKVTCDAFRHGSAFGSPFKKPAFAHYAEFEWADRAGFDAAVGSPEFAAAGKDAMEMGVPFSVTFLELD
jgi:hypothetical protein